MSNNKSGSEWDELLNSFAAAAEKSGRASAGAEASDEVIEEIITDDITEEADEPEEVREYVPRKAEEIDTDAEIPDIIADAAEEASQDDEASADEEPLHSEDISDDTSEEEAASHEEDDERQLKANFGVRNNDDEDYDDDDDEDEPRSRRKKRRHRPGRIVFALVMTTLIISVSIFIAVSVLYVVRAVTGIDRNDTQIVVDIPENSNGEEIANLLYDEGIIVDADIFRIMAKLKHVDSKFVAGSHILSPNMTYSDIMEELMTNVEAERETVDLTFREGINLYDAAHILESNGVCDADRFIYIFNSSSFGFDFEEQVETSSEKFYKMEGFLFPDTYTFYLDEEPEVVAKKFYRNFNNRVTPDYYGRMKDLGLSLEETITLASMVQAEANNKKDMKMIASVFLNRLNNPRQYPRLESDPTTNYAEEVIQANLEIPDEKLVEAYDTYRGKGLPPGAICSPGLDAITAVLYPAETDYYFFCADLDTGEVFYAETYEEHQQNLVKANLIG